MKNILFFGDSNTYGYKPDKSGRYDYDVRWTGRIANLLGNEYNIIEEGLCGRTTIFPDAVRDARKGIDLIGVVVESHKPVDVISIMLGTNARLNLMLMQRQLQREWKQLQERLRRQRENM